MTKGYPGSTRQPNASNQDRDDSDMKDEYWVLGIEYRPTQYSILNTQYRAKA